MPTSVDPIDWYTPRPPAPDLHELIACVWTAHPDGEHRLVPDGCVDVVWLDDGRSMVCGTETAAWTFQLPPGRRAAGIRFRPGVAPGVLGFRGAEAANRRVPLGQVIPERAVRHLHQRLADAPTAHAWTTVLEDEARRWAAAAHRPVDPVVRAAASVAGERGRLRVDELADACHLSSRQLHRRCLTVFGYGPSMLARILRLQRFLQLAPRPPTRPGAGALAPLAAAAGYTDQAHLTRDCRALAGVTPAALLAERIAR